MKYLKCQYCERKMTDSPQCRDCTRSHGYKWFSIKGEPEARQEAVWQLNLDNFKARLLGDPTDPETMLRYWKAQEAAGYPSASENVKYFTDIVERLKAVPPSGREARWRGARGWYYCSLCQGETQISTRYCPDCGARMTNYKETETDAT